MRPFENHSQWSHVKEVCLSLRAHGYRALLAGGCVRDLLMGRSPNDFDIATNATPDQVEAIFPESIGVGKSFGVMVLPRKTSGGDVFQLEVATFREDLAYVDGRRPESVKFSSPQADASRRDFTVNALFLDPETDEIIDYVDGRKDLFARIIRTVGEPQKRFEEDKLRLMRAIRFAAQLEFEIAPETFESIVKLSKTVSVVSRERIRDELLKLMKTAQRVHGLRLLIDSGLLAAAFPKAAPFILKNEEQWLKRFSTFSSLGSSAHLTRPIVPIALFFAPVYANLNERDFREHHLADLRLDQKTSEAVLFCLRHLNDVLKPDRVRRGTLSLLLANEAGPDLEHLAAIEEIMTGLDEHERTNRKASLLSALAALSANRTKPNQFISGGDLRALGVEPGPKMGELLAESYLLQLEGELGTRESVLNWIKNRI